MLQCLCVTANKQSVYILVLIALLLGGGVFSWHQLAREKPTEPELVVVAGSINEDQTPPPETEPIPPEPWGGISRRYRIDHIEWAYRNNQPYHPQFNFIEGLPEDYVATFYQPFKEPEDTENKDWNGGGILLFKIKDNTPILVWENNDHFGGTRPGIGVRDMTGDGKKELLISWSRDAYNEALYIYEMIGDDFQLISPYASTKADLEEYGGVGIPVHRFRGIVSIDDLDGDEIPEVWFPTGLDNYGHLTSNHYLAYKWNGTEYVEWKRQDEPFKNYGDN